MNRQDCLRGTEMVPFLESVEHGMFQKPITTIPIALYRCGDGGDAKEGGAESYEDDPSRHPSTKLLRTRGPGPIPCRGPGFFVAAILPLRNEEKGWELRLSAYPAIAVAVAMLLAGCGAQDAPVEQVEQDATVSGAAPEAETTAQTAPPKPGTTAEQPDPPERRSDLAGVLDEEGGGSTSGYATVTDGTGALRSRGRLELGRRRASIKGWA
jgi:hypothetical protein